MIEKPASLVIHSVSKRSPLSNKTQPVQTRPPKPKPADPKPKPPPPKPKKKDKPIVYYFPHQSLGATVKSELQRKYKAFEHAGPLFDFKCRNLPYKTVHAIPHDKFDAWVENDLKTCKGQDVQTFTLEFSGFNEKISPQMIHKHFRTVIMLRDPFARLLHNFFYDLENYDWARQAVRQKIGEQGGTLEVQMNAFQEMSKHHYTAFNMYTRLLGGLMCDRDGTCSVDETNETFERAKEILMKADVVIVFEKPESFKLVNRVFGVSVTTVDQAGWDKYKNVMNSKDLVQYRKKFKELAKYDYELYDLALKIVEDRLKGK